MKLSNVLICTMIHTIRGYSINNKKGAITLLFLDELSEVSVQTFIKAAKDDGFDAKDIDRGLSSKVQNCEDTFKHLNLRYDKQKRIKGN